jgi:hypothetical protein
MWFSEKALVFVDTRSAALAVYKQTLRGPRLVRFASERLSARSRSGSLFAEVLSDAREAVEHLSRELKAPQGDATLLLPIGATFPLIVDLKALKRGHAPEVDDADLVRFRLAPLLPFPISQAEVRTEVSTSLGPGAVLAQAILASTIVDCEKVMDGLGFPRPRVTSSLSAALRGLPPRGHDVDLIFGDSACALAVRNLGGVIEAIHLRLLVEGDDRAGRSIDEALRSAANLRSIRALGEDEAALQSRAGEVTIHPAFDLPALRGSADPQRFPFLSVFHEGAA